MKKLPIYSVLFFTLFNILAIFVGLTIGPISGMFSEYLYKLSTFIFNTTSSNVIILIITLFVTLYAIYKTNYKKELSLILVNLIILFLFGTYFNNLKNTGKEVNRAIIFYYNKNQFLPENLFELENYQNLNQENINSSIVYKMGQNKSNVNSYRIFIIPKYFKSIELLYNRKNDDFDFFD